MNNWKEERLKYTRCSLSKKPTSNDELYYKYENDKIRDSSLHKCILVKTHTNGIFFHFGDDIVFGPLRFTNFFILNKPNEQL